MSEISYSNEEIVKAFKSFIVKVIDYAAIDFARKIKNKKYDEVLFSEAVDEKVSLSNYDNDTFFAENIYKISSIVSELSQKDRKIFYFMTKGKGNKEIAKIMNLSEKTIRNKKTLIRNIIKKELEKNEI